MGMRALRMHQCHTQAGLRVLLPKEEVMGSVASEPRATAAVSKREAMALVEYYERQAAAWAKAQQPELSRQYGQMADHWEVYVHNLSS